jgi:hypothetical protein
MFLRPSNQFHSSLCFSKFLPYENNYFSLCMHHICPHLAPAVRTQPAFRWHSDTPLRMCTLFSLCLCSSDRGASTPFVLRANDTENLRESGYDPKNPTKILIHGFAGDGDSSNIIRSKNGKCGISVALPLQSIQKCPLTQHGRALLK